LSSHFGSAFGTEGMYGGPHVIQHPLFFKLSPVIQIVRIKIKAAKDGTISKEADKVVLIKHIPQKRAVNIIPPRAWGKRSFQLCSTISKISIPNVIEPTKYAGQHPIYYLVRLFNSWDT
jgi:hypothetical protein